MAYFILIIILLINFKFMWLTCAISWIHDLKMYKIFFSIQTSASSHEKVISNFIIQLLRDRVVLET